MLMIGQTAPMEYVRDASMSADAVSYDTVDFAVAENTESTVVIDLMSTVSNAADCKMYVSGIDDKDNLLFNDELFGPVLAVTSFSDDAEALALANDSPFGLLIGIWTNNLSRAHLMARDLESGMVSINEYPITFPQTAFTGWKQSGIGVEQSQDAMRFYTKVKNVNLKL